MMHDEGVCLHCLTCDEIWNCVVMCLICEVQLVVVNDVLVVVVVVNDVLVVVMVSDVV